MLLVSAFFETVYMVLASTFFAVLIGVPLGVMLTLTHSKILGWLVNICRSIPFAILMIALIPFTRLIVGTSIGTTASIVPLSIAAIPFFARLVETAFTQVDQGLIEAAMIFKATRLQICRKVLIAESLPTLISGATVTAINLVGYSAMAGLVGGGGLGMVAIQYGYQRFDVSIMLSTIVLLVLLVEALQWCGNRLSNHYLHKWGKR